MNLAARLQGESRGGDVVISAPLAETEGAAAVIARHPPPPRAPSLRGLSEPVAFVRLRVDQA